MIRKFILFPFFIFLYSTIVAQTKNTVFIHTGFLDLDKISPRQFFDSLKLRRDTVDINTIIFSGVAPPGWISESDVNYFMNYIYSKEKCACLMAIQSNYVPPLDCSNLGAQAQNLITAFRQKTQFFPGLTNCDKTDSIKAKEIENWWKDYKNKGNEKSKSGLFTDPRDGIIYKTVEIGSQVWMAENLNYLTPNSGCDQCNVYGRLYSYDEALIVCPLGWHLPSDAEWTKLTTYLGGDSVAGGKLKEKGINHWHSLNTGATNESNFTALPGGCRQSKESITPTGRYGYWWTATESANKESAWMRILYFDYKKINRTSIYTKHDQFSVRCLKD